VIASRFVACSVLTFSLCSGVREAFALASIPVALPAGSTSIDDTREDGLLVPLTVDDGWGVDKEVKRVAVTLGDDHGAGLLDAFPTVEVDGQAPGAVLRVTVTRKLLVKPGAYFLTLTMGASRSNARDGGGDRWTGEIVVPFTKVAPTLRVPPSGLIDIVVYPREDEIVAPPIDVDEISRRARLTGLAIRQVGSLMAEGKPAPGTISFSALHDLDAGEGETVVFTNPKAPVTRAELGRSIGTVEVVADQLTAPQAMTIEVRRRLWSGWIAVLFCVGGAVGAVVRRWAQRVLARTTLVNEVDELRKKLTELASRSLIEDAVLLGMRRTAMEEAAKSEEVNALENAKKNAEKSCDQVQKKNEELLAQYRKRIEADDALEKLVLPASIQSVLGDPADLKKLLDSARAAVAGEQVKAVADLLAQLDEKMRACSGPTKAWLGSLEDAATKIPADQKGVAAELRPPLERMKGFRARVAKLESEATGVRQLAKVDLLFDDVKRMRDQAQGGLVQLAQAADVRFKLCRPMAKIVADLATLPTSSDPIADIAATLGAMNAIAKTVREAPTPPEANKDIRAKLDTGDFDGAFASLDAAVPTVFGGEQPVVMLPAAPAASEPRAEVAVAEAADAKELPVRSVATKGDRWRDKIANVLRFAFAYTALPASAWYLYSPTFVGGIRELMALFAAGFVTDFTFDSATEVFGKIRGKE
jgi:hypothetical protein